MLVGMVLVGNSSMPYWIMSQRIEMVDLTPRFLDFYTRAVSNALAPDERWQLWQSSYGFAAVPPTPAGQDMARRTLDAAWDRYPSVMQRIRHGMTGMASESAEALTRVAELLECEVEVRLHVIAFVGTFYNGAFVTYIEGGMPALALAVEEDPDDRAFILPHELTHVVHAANSGTPITWERSLAQLVLQEGLAMRATERLLPGWSDAEYVNEDTPGWFDACAAHQEEILLAVREDLHSIDSATIEKFTIGTVAANLDRAAYYAGWQVVKALVEEDWSLAELSKVPPDDVPGVVETALDRLGA